MDNYLIVSIAIAAVAVLLLLWWLRGRKAQPTDTVAMEDRLDTLIGWPPEATRVLRTSERLAYSTLKLALPGYMILAQVPLSRFINVPKRNSYAEWMRRLGSQCVDFVICDVTSQVIAVIDVRPPESQLSSRQMRRLDRVARTLEAVGIHLHIWNEESLPTVETARASIVPNEPAVPVKIASRQKLSAVAPAAVQAIPERPADLDGDEFVEVIEMPEPSSSTWFDDLDSVPAFMPPPAPRTGR